MVTCFCSRVHWAVAETGMQIQHLPNNTLPLRMTSWGWSNDVEMPLLTQGLVFLIWGLHTPKHPWTHLVKKMREEWITVNNHWTEWTIRPCLMLLWLILKQAVDKWGTGDLYRYLQWRAIVKARRGWTRILTFIILEKWNNWRDLYKKLMNTIISWVGVCIKS